MPTNKTINVYQDVPLWVKARARGYWDKKTVLLYSSNNENQNMAMDVYDGLRYTATAGSNASVIDFSGTVLPYKWDYEDKLKDLRYYFLPITGGQTITKYELNGTKVGNPTFDEDSGIASGFSTSNRLQTPTDFNPQNSTWSVKFKFTTGSTVTNNTIIGSAYNNNIENILLRINSSKKMWFLVSTSSGGWDIIGTSIQGSYVFLENTTYYCEALYDGTNYIFKYSTDGETYTTDIIVQSSSSIGSGIIQFGAHTFSGGTDTPFNGSIDLSQTHVKIDDEIWWEGTTVITKYNQYTITNTLESDLSDLSGCPSTLLDEDNFVIIDGKLANGPKSYNVNNGYSYGYIEYTPSETLTITIKAYVSSEGGYDYGACYIGTQMYEATRSQITNGTTDGNGEWIFKISGSTSETSYTKELTGGTTYYIQFYYTKDGSTHGGSDRIFITALENFNGFTVTKTETLPGCSADYTDDGSAVTLNCFAIGDEKVILTPNNNYTNGTYLGTVNIPSHTNL